MAKVKTHWELEYEKLAEKNSIILKEGLILSHDKGYLASELNLKFGITPNYINSVHGNCLFVISKIDLTQSTEFKRYLDLYGFFVSKNTQNGNQWECMIEPKFPSEVMPKDLEPIVYHVSPTKNKNKILSKGLNPKISSTSFNHNANRIYFLMRPKTQSSPQNDLIVLIKILRNNRSSIDIERTIYDIYEVSTNNAETYYYDPMLTNSAPFECAEGIFGFKSVHPNRITHVATY